MLAQEIQERRFTTAFRGYDPTEVRQFLAHVAGLYGDMKGRLAKLAEGEVVASGALVDGAEERNDANSEALAASEANRAAVAEVARVDAQRQADDLLAAARSEAQTIVSRANDEAARIVLRARAESRGKPSAERNAAIEAALAEVPGDPEQAREQARLMISEARAVRERILADLAKRRRTAHVQLEQLRVAREKLLETLRDARRVVEDASRDLSTAEVEARLAAETAGRRVASEAMPSTDELEAELFGGRYAQSPQRSSAEIVSAEMSSESAMSQTETSIDIVVTELVVTGVLVTDADATDQRAHSMPTDAALADTVLPNGVLTNPVLADFVVEDRWGDAAVSDGEPSSEAVGEPEMAAAADAVDESPEVEPVVDSFTVTSAVAIGREPAAVDDVVGASGGGPVGVVDDLFARLRAERTDAAEHARRVLSVESTTKVKKPRAPRQSKIVPDHSADAGGAPEAVLAPEASEPVLMIDGTDAPEGSFEAVTDDESSAVAIGRDPAAVAAVVAQRLARSIKRHLSDEQGSALVALRTARGLPHIDALVGTDTDQRERLAGVVGRSLADSGTTLDDSDLAPVIDDVVGDVRSGLSGALSLVRDGSADVADLPEAIASVYRAWTTERLDALLRRVAPIAA